MHWPHGSLPSQRIFLRLHSVQAWGVVMRRVPATLGLALLEAAGCFLGMMPWTSVLLGHGDDDDVLRLTYRCERSHQRQPWYLKETC